MERVARGARGAWSAWRVERVERVARGVCGAWSVWGARDRVSGKRAGSRAVLGARPSAEVRKSYLTCCAVRSRAGERVPQGQGAARDRLEGARGVMRGCEEA